MFGFNFCYEIRYYSTQFELMLLMHDGMMRTYNNVQPRVWKEFRKAKTQSNREAFLVSELGKYEFKEEKKGFPNYEYLSRHR